MKTKCEKCSGTGSEGFISVSRCVPCGGSGEVECKTLAEPRRPIYGDGERLSLPDKLRGYDLHPEVVATWDGSIFHMVAEAPRDGVHFAGHGASLREAEQGLIRAVTRHYGSGIQKPISGNSHWETRTNSNGESVRVRVPGPAPRLDATQWAYKQLSGTTAKPITDLVDLQITLTDPEPATNPQQAYIERIESAMIAALQSPQKIPFTTDGIKTMERLILQNLESLPEISNVQILHNGHRNLDVTCDIVLHPAIKVTL